MSSLTANAIMSDAYGFDRMAKERDESKINLSGIRLRLRAALREYRTENKISTNRLAVLMQTDAATLRLFLQGRRGIGFSVFIKARTHLHLNLNQIVDLPPAKGYEGPDPTPPDEPMGRTRPMTVSHPFQGGRRTAVGKP